MAVTLNVRTNPTQIGGGDVAVIGLEVTDNGQPMPDVTVILTHVEGKECGSLAQTQGSTDVRGFLGVDFTGRQHVKECTARIQAIVPGTTAEASPQAEAFTEVAVHTAGAPPARVDGLAAIALVLILSFAIDRIVRGLLFALSYIPGWARRFPDPELDDVVVTRRADTNRRLVYFLLAAALAIGAIGWFGEVRLLAALGFVAVSPVLDVIVTGLVLTAGAERTERVLQSLGAGSAPASAPKPTPIEITGRLTIDEHGKRTLGV